MTAEEKHLAFLMHTLKISEAEAKSLMEDDRRIDKGEKLFELEGEAKKASKQARQAPRKPTAYQFTQREKKAKPEKAEICSAMMEGLAAFGVKSFDVTNAEREFIFVHNGTKYKVTLACPRS